MIITKTPLRISLVGGSTDIPEFYEKHPSVCTSFAINKYVYITLNDNFDGRYRISYSQTENVDYIGKIQHNLVRDTLQWFSGFASYSQLLKGLEITSIADVPGGTGLGSSSSFLVGLIKAIYHRVGMDEIYPSQLASVAYKTEGVSNPGIGKQDHFAAAHGGFNKYEFNSTHDIVTEVKSKWDCDNPWSRNDLEQYMLLLWTGITRKSNGIMDGRKEGFASGKTTATGEALVALANTFYQDMTNGRVQEAAQYLTAGWELKKMLAPGISNDRIENWMDIAFNNGAWGGKLCGAGGGGFLFFIAPPDTHSRIVETTGLRKVPFKIEQRGSEVIYDG